MKSNRTNFLRFLLQSEPGKPAIANGLRAGLAWGVPLLIGYFTDHRESGLYIGLMAYFVNLANVGGPYRIKATAMAIATLGMAVSVVVGTLVAGVPTLAVLLILLWGVGAGLASLYGAAGSSVGLVVGLSFISAIAQPRSLTVALLRFVLCLMGGGWAMLLSLVMWPLNPYYPLRKAVASCYNAIADYLQAFQENQIQTGVDSRKTTDILAIRKALENARTALGVERMGQPNRSWMDEQLLVLIQDAERLLGSIIALSELIEINSGYQQFRAVQLLVDEALEQISLITKATAKVISGKPAAISFGNLDRIYEALQEQRHLQRIAISDREVDYPALLALTNLLLMIEKLIKQLHYAADTARFLDADIHSESRNAEPVALAEQKQRSILSRLRDNLTFDSAIFRHALRIGVTLAVGVTLYTLTNLKMGSWITLTIMIVLKPDFGATFKRFFQRVGGTILGAILAAVIAAAIANKLVLDTITVLTVFFGISLLKVNYGYAVVFISIFVLLVSNIAHPIGWQFAGIRMLNTLIGAGLAFGGHYLMWPSWERQRFPKQLATALRQCRHYFQKVMAVYQGEKEDKSSIISQRRCTGLAISNAQSSFQGLLGEPQAQVGLVEPFMALLVYMGRFTNAITVLAVHLDHFRGTQPLPELETFVRQIEVVLEQLADSAQEETPPPPLPDIEGTLQKIHPYLQALRTARVQEIEAANHGHTPVRQAVIDYSVLDMELDQIVRRVSAMHCALVRLSAQLHSNEGKLINSNPVIK